MVITKETQHNEIRDIRNNTIDLEQAIRNAHDSYINGDVNELLKLTSDHSINRQEYHNTIVSIIDQLENNLNVIVNANDLKNVEYNLLEYKKNIDDYETEVSIKDNKLYESNKENLYYREEVDKNRHARSDMECENKNIEDTRLSYDNLRIDNHKYNSENQDLNTQIVQVHTDLHEVNERMNAVIEVSPDKRDLVASSKKYLDASIQKFKSNSRFDRSGYNSNRKI